MFGKDETPFNEEIPYLRMVQPPENLVKENGRFNASGQSRFYLTSHKFGAYFEYKKNVLTKKLMHVNINEIKIWRNRAMKLEIRLNRRVITTK